MYQIKDSILYKNGIISFTDGIWQSILPSFRMWSAVRSTTSRNTPALWLAYAITIPTVYASTSANESLAYPGLKRYDKKEYTYEQKVFMPYYGTDDLPALTGIVPIAQAQVRNLGIQVLQGEGYTLLALTNLSPIEKTMDAKLCVNIPFTSAQFTSVDDAGSLSVNGSEIPSGL